MARGHFLAGVWSWVARRVSLESGFQNHSLRREKQVMKAECRL